MKNLQLGEPVSDELVIEPYSCISSDLQVDFASRTIQARIQHSRSDEKPWVELAVRKSWAPPCPISPVPSRLAQDERIFWTIAKALDTYALKQSGSKSNHIVISDIARTLTKTFEYVWSRGFYDLGGVPEAIWLQLREDLVKGSWAYALRLEERTVRLLADCEIPPADFLYEGHRAISSDGIKLSLRGGFLDLLGTNAATQELTCVKALILQAARDDDLRRRGDILSYQRTQPRGMSVTMLLQTLRAIDLLAEVPLALRARNLPADNVYRYAQKKGRAGGRTENIDPDTWAKLLTHAYKWIYEYGPYVVEAVRVIALHLESYYDEDMQQRCQEDSSTRSYRSTLIKRNSFAFEEVHKLEGRLGLKITNFVRKNNKLGETSVYAVIGQLFSACFVVIASMNARRKDEVLGRRIGLHLDSLTELDGNLGLYECEFYIEKSVKDYVPHLVNDVSRRAVQLLQGIAEIAWDWSEKTVPNRPRSEGRERKIFTFPAFVGRRKGVLWYDFNANEEKLSEAFLTDALGKDRDKYKVSPHMFRRAYGLLYHYRFENAILIVLTQKYGHVDTTSTLTYVTDGCHTEFGKTAAAKWSAPEDVIQRAHKVHTDELTEIIREVGNEKLRAYVLDVIEGSRKFSGGFAKLVARYHRKLSSQISYQQLDSTEKKSKLSDALIARGHAPYPYPGNTCMAGTSRKHSACSVEKGVLARENASPIVCSSCPYSDTSGAQLHALKRDEEIVAKYVTQQPVTVKEIAEARNLENLRRVIELHSRRLGLAP